MAGHSEWELLLLGCRAMPRALQRSINWHWLGRLTIVGILGLLLLAIIFIQIPSCVYHLKMAECKKNLHEVQLAVERFAVDSPGAHYPLDPAEVITLHYLPEMPTNPFTREPMRWVVLAELELQAPRPDGLAHGDFGYFPRPDNLNAAQPLDLRHLRAEDIYGYTLVLY